MTKLSTECYGNSEANATTFGITAEVEDHIKEALLKAFARVEDEFILYSIEKQDFSGCCANVVVLHADKVYSANLGDSRAIMIRAADGKVCTKDFN
jgi:serine/threonine protein phosphatase PrpC